MPSGRCCRCTVTASALGRSVAGGGSWCFWRRVQAGERGKCVSSCRGTRTWLRCTKLSWCSHRARLNEPFGPNPAGSAASCVATGALACRRRKQACLTYVQPVLRRRVASQRNTKRGVTHLLLRAQASQLRRDELLNPWLYRLERRARHGRLADGALSAAAALLGSKDLGKCTTRCRAPRTNTKHQASCCADMRSRSS